MSIITSPSPSSVAKPIEPPTDRLFRLTVDQYHKMIDTGILVDGDPIELLDGLLIEKMTKKPPHAYSTDVTREMLARTVPPGWFVRSQDPITLMESEPEPDCSVVRGDRRQYLKRHPGPADVGIVVEVSDASREQDREWKRRIYAEANIPVYWIVNLIDRQVEVYTDPTGPSQQPDYRLRKDHLPSDGLPVVLDGKEVGSIAVRDLLP
jgi:Uma2 family endonuclease